MTEQRQPKVGIAKIYVKDISFESPGAPRVFRRQINPEIGLKVNVEATKLDEQMHEVSLIMTAEAIQEEATTFIVEIEQAGIFEVRDASDAQRDTILNVFCPTTLFPYARQTIDALLQSGGFPPLMLAPFNFEGLYYNKKLSLNRDK